MLVPCTWAPAWRLHTNLYKFWENVSSHIFHEKNCCDLNLGESLCICRTFFLFPDSGLNLLNGFDFLFWFILNGVTLKTSNIVLAHAREEAKNEVRSKIFIYDRLGTEVHVGDLCSPCRTH